MLDNIEINYLFKFFFFKWKTLFIAQTFYFKEKCQIDF